MSHVAAFIARWTAWATLGGVAGIIALRCTVPWGATSNNDLLLANYAGAATFVLIGWLAKR